MLHNVVAIADIVRIMLVQQLGKGSKNSNAGKRGKSSNAGTGNNAGKRAVTLARTVMQLFMLL